MELEIFTTLKMESYSMIKKMTFEICKISKVIVL